MKVLHYSLGFPPYRSGGLTKFALDLMREQLNEGNEVALLWPGEMKLFNKAVGVRNSSDFENIKSFELINSLPISYDEGIENILPMDANMIMSCLNLESLLSLRASMQILNH